MAKYWGEKRYYFLDYYVKEQLYKLALNGGLTCPNRDGTLGTTGCIFCTEGGSGRLLQVALRPDIVIHRLTSDGAKSILIEPKWTANKRQVLSQLQPYFKKHDIW